MARHVRGHKQKGSLCILCVQFSLATRCFTLTWTNLTIWIDGVFFSVFVVTEIPETFSRI